MKFLHGIPTKKKEQQKTLGNLMIPMIPISSQVVLAMEGGVEKEINIVASSDLREFNYASPEGTENLDLDCDFIIDTSVTSSATEEFSDLYTEIQSQRLALGIEDDKYFQIPQSPRSTTERMKLLNNVNLKFNPFNQIDMDRIDKRSTMMLIGNGIPLSLSKLVSIIMQPITLLHNQTTREISNLKDLNTSMVGIHAINRDQIKYIDRLIKTAKTLYLPFVGSNDLWNNTDTDDETRAGRLYAGGFNQNQAKIADDHNRLKNIGERYISKEEAKSILQMPLYDTTFAKSHENLAHLLQYGATNYHNREFVPTRDDEKFAHTPYLMIVNRVGETDIEYLQTCKDNNVTRLISQNEQQLALAGYMNPLLLNYFSHDEIKEIKEFTIQSFKSVSIETQLKIKDGIKYGRWIQQLASIESSADGRQLGTSIGGNGAINIAEKNARITFQASKDLTREWQVANGQLDPLFSKPKVDLITFYQPDLAKFLDVRLPVPRDMAFDPVKGKKVTRDLGAFYSYAYSETNIVSIFASIPFSQKMKDVAEAFENSTSITSIMVNQHRNVKRAHAKNGPASGVSRQRVTDEKIKQHSIPVLEQALRNDGTRGNGWLALDSILARIGANHNISDPNQENVLNRLTLSSLPFLDTAVATMSPYSKNLLPMVRDGYWTGVSHTEDKGKLFNSTKFLKGIRFDPVGREFRKVGYGFYTLDELKAFDQSTWNKAVKFGNPSGQSGTGTLFHNESPNDPRDLLHAIPTKFDTDLRGQERDNRIAFLNEAKTISDAIKNAPARSFDYNNPLSLSARDRLILLQMEPQVQKQAQLQVETHSFSRGNERIIYPNKIERAIDSSVFSDASSSGGLLTPSRLLNMEQPKGIESWGIKGSSAENRVYPFAVPAISILSARADETLNLFNKKRPIDIDTKQPVTQEKNLSVKIFGANDVPLVADALLNYYEEAKTRAFRSNKFGLTPNVALGIIGADGGIYGAPPIVVTEDSRMEARAEYYSLRYISLLITICGWILNKNNPKSNNILTELLGTASADRKIGYIEFTNKFFNLLREIYTGGKRASDFSEFREIYGDVGTYDKLFKDLDYRVFSQMTGLQKSETRFFNLCLGEERHFKDLFTSYIMDKGYILEEDFTRQGELANCLKDGGKEARDELNDLASAPIQDYLSSLGLTPDEIIFRVCKALTEPEGSDRETLEDLRFKGTNFSQAQIATTVSLMTAGAVAPNEWMQRLSRNGKLDLGLMPIDNIEAFIAQVARTASESGIENVKDLLKKYLPEEDQREVDLDGIVDAVDELVEKEREATDNALFGGSVGSRNKKIAVGAVLGILAVGGFIYYKKKKENSNV